jgi:TetR/AcrR family transcriptional regulator of autoinduction and epiphytic fitness
VATRAEATQTRILEATWDLVQARGAGAVTMQDVADAVGVTRQLVYVRFGDRARLLVAAARHHDERSGFRERVAATRRLPPTEGFEALLREWWDYVPDILPVAAALHAAAASSEDAAVAWRDRMDDLREAFRVALARVRRAGRLAPGWSVEAAADWVWMRTHLTGWEQLVKERGWRPERYVERTVRSILGELVVPAP